MKAKQSVRQSEEFQKKEKETSLQSKKTARQSV